MVADVTVVGAGIIALMTALELADRKLTVRLVGTTHAGNASGASGGILAPTINPVSGPAGDFAVASRDRYPSYVAALTERTGRPIPLNFRGVLVLGMTDHQAENMNPAADAATEWLDSAALRALEPALGHASGAALHTLDGSVEPLFLLDALRVAVAAHDRIVPVREDVCSVHDGDSGCTLVTEMENRFASDYVVMAAGAWTPLIEGVDVPAIPVRPMRGQMVAFAATPIRHVTYGAGAYLIPKSDGNTVAGSTSEYSGFDVRTTEAGLASIRERAYTTCPALAGVGERASWSGLRPVTPDMLPVIGPDADRPRVIYACGHSRNGILLAPLTAEAVADLLTGTPTKYDIGQFRPGRFQDRFDS